jgi:hypothetical protein
MLAEYRRKTNIGVGLGIALRFLAVVLAVVLGEKLATLALSLVILLVVVSTILLVWGCCCYAKGKGYEGSWGFLALFFGLLGFLIIACFRDKYKVKEKWTVTGNTCRNCGRKIAECERATVVENELVCNECEERLSTSGL